MHGVSRHCICNDYVTVWMSVQLAQLVERPHRMREDSPSQCKVLLGCRTICVLWCVWSWGMQWSGEGVLVLSHILLKRSFDQFWNWNRHTFLGENTTPLSCFIFWIRLWLYSYYNKLTGLPLFEIYVCNQHGYIPLFSNIMQTAQPLSHSESLLWESEHLEANLIRKNLLCELILSGLQNQYEDVEEQRRINMFLCHTSIVPQFTCHN